MRSLVLADWNSSTLADSAIYSPEWDPSPDTMAAEVAPGVTKLNWAGPVPFQYRFRGPAGSPTINRGLILPTQPQPRDDRERGENQKTAEET